MKDFSIKELEQFSGIKAHTIRIWEKRYGVLKPSRSLGNTRHYNIDEVKRLLDISLLNNNGYKISELVRLDGETLRQKQLNLSSVSNRQLYTVYSLIYHLYARKYEEFEAILDDCTIAFGIDATITKVIIPFLEKADLLYYNNQSNEIHFAVTAARKKIIFGIEQAKYQGSKTAKAILFLQEKEHYDLMLLYVAYQLKKAGVQLLYLGTNVSQENVKRITAEKKPDFLYTYITPKQKFKLQDIITFLSKNLAETKLMITYAENNLSIKKHDNVRMLHYNDIENFVAEMVA